MATVLVGLFLLAVRCLSSTADTIITTVEPMIVHPAITDEWYTSNGCSISITEPSFVFDCDKAGIFTLPTRNSTVELSEPVIAK